MLRGLLGLLSLLFGFFRENTTVEKETWKKVCEHWKCWFLNKVFCCDSVGRQKISLNFSNILLLEGTLLHLMPRASCF